MTGCIGKRHPLTVNRNLLMTMKMNGHTLKGKVRHHSSLYLSSFSLSLSLSLNLSVYPSLSLSPLLTSAKKNKKDKNGTFSSPSRGKSGRGPGRPPKHPRIEETTTSSSSSDVLSLKVSSHCLAVIRLVLTVLYVPVYMYM